MNNQNKQVLERLSDLLNGNGITLLAVKAIIKLEDKKFDNGILGFISADKETRKSVLEFLSQVLNIVKNERIKKIEKEKIKSYIEFFSILTESLKIISDLLQLDEQKSRISEEELKIIKNILEDIYNNVVDPVTINKVLELTEDEQIRISYSIKEYPLNKSRLLQ